MSEEKLETFGELLKKTLGSRAGGEEIISEENSAILSDGDRTAIFEKLAKVAPAAPKSNTPKVVSESNTDDANASFGELLEKATQTRMEIENEDNKADEEIREAVVENS